MAKSRKQKKAEPAKAGKAAKAGTITTAELKAEGVSADAIDITIGGVKRQFDISNPELPAWVKDASLTSGGYPYDDKMKRSDYDEALEALQIELVKLQVWLQKSGERVMILFEGRDAAGKGGTIDVVREYMNPRQARNVALTKPTETERGQWYYQRYVSQFPTAGEFVTFDRSWYNRAGVEPVMGFCTPKQHEHFLDETPDFEKLIVKEGIKFFKFFLNIGQEMQLKRFHDRRHSPLTIWKFSPMDIAGMTRWDDYTQVLSRMFAETDSKHAPWIVVNSNDKRRARIETIRHILLALDYDGRDLAKIGKPDGKIIGSPKAILKD